MKGVITLTLTELRQAAPYTLKEYSEIKVTDDYGTLKLHLLRTTEPLPED